MQHFILSSPGNQQLPSVRHLFSHIFQTSNDYLRSPQLTSADPHHRPGIVLAPAYNYSRDDDADDLVLPPILPSRSLPPHHQDDDYAANSHLGLTPMSPSRTRSLQSKCSSMQMDMSSMAWATTWLVEQQEAMVAMLLFELGEEMPQGVGVDKDNEVSLTSPCEQQEAAELSGSQIPQERMSPVDLHQGQGHPHESYMTPAWTTASLFDGHPTANNLYDSVNSFHIDHRPSDFGNEDQPPSTPGLPTAFVYTVGIDMMNLLLCQSFEPTCEHLYYNSLYRAPQRSFRDTMTPAEADAFWEYVKEYGDGHGDNEVDVRALSIEYSPSIPSPHPEVPAPAFDFVSMIKPSPRAFTATETTAPAAKTSTSTTTTAQWPLISSALTNESSTTANAIAASAIMNNSGSMDSDNHNSNSSNSSNRSRDESGVADPLSYRSLNPYYYGTQYFLASGIVDTNTCTGANSVESATEPDDANEATPTREIPAEATPAVGVASYLSATTDGYGSGGTSLFRPHSSDLFAATRKRNWLSRLEDENKENVDPRIQKKSKYMEVSFSTDVLNTVTPSRGTGTTRKALIPPLHSDYHSINNITSSSSHQSGNSSFQNNFSNNINIFYNINTLNNSSSNTLDENITFNSNNISKTNNNGMGTNSNFRNLIGNHNSVNNNINIGPPSYDIGAHSNNNIINETIITANATSKVKYVSSTEM